MQRPFHATPLFRLVECVLLSVWLDKRTNFHFLDSDIFMDISVSFRKENIQILY
jgi:hypothetical protein